MRKPRTQTAAPLPMLPPLPGWIVSSPAETIEAAAFRSGAALAHLAILAGSPDIPQALWRERLALAAAEVCAGLTGRREGSAALRDALHLTKAGDDPGPAGNLLRQWSQAVGRPVSVKGLVKVLHPLPLDQIALLLDMAGPTPMDRAAQVIQAVLANNPRAEATALILADAVLAQAMGWDHLLPLLALRISARDLRLSGADLRLACHRAIVAGAGQAVPVAADLARRATRLRAVLPKLRAKAAGQAVELFLSRDALAPVALAMEMPSMSDRAARRLCDRLVDLGALRELTGRETFRLYGV